MYLSLRREKYCEQYRCQKIALGSRTVALDSLPNVFYLRWRVLLSAHGLVQMDHSELSMKPGTWPWVTAVGARSITSISRKLKKRTLSQNVRSLRNSSTAGAHVCGVKYGTVGFITIRDFSFWGESDLWSDFWPAIALGWWSKHWPPVHGLPQWTTPKGHPKMYFLRK